MRPLESIPANGRHPVTDENFQPSGGHRNQYLAKDSAHVMEIELGWLCSFCCRQLDFVYGDRRRKLFSFVRSFARWSRRFFGEANIFEKYDRLDAIVLVKKSWKSVASSRFLGILKI